MPPTVMAAPVHPAGKRAGSMLMRLTRTLVPFVRASPAAGKAAERLRFSPAMRVSFASRVKPMHLLPEQLSPVVAALPSSQVSALLRWPQPTVGGVQKSVVQTLASSQVFGTPTHAPLKQVSATVQTLPSLHALKVGVPPPQTPAPSHVVAVRHTFVPVHGAPAGSNWQVDEQQSPSSVLPSSHCSPGSTTPLPQIEAFFPMRLKRFVWTPPGGSPGPSTRKKFVPHGLPVIGCGITKSPMAPAGGAGGVASHWSQVLMKENGASGVVKALNPVGDGAPQVGGTERRQASGKLVLRRPGPAACK